VIGTAVAREEWLDHLGRRGAVEVAGLAAALSYPPARLLLAGRPARP
jgi:hypothetical protein